MGTAAYELSAYWEQALDAERWANPLVRSGLVMAQRNPYRMQPHPEQAEDGLLTAYEIAWMNLQDTDLVVLSACDTGIGDVVSGEGILGLGRSFQLAGAQTVVMSLWQVSDRATRDLMVDFYTRLNEGTSKTEALRQAALKIKEDKPHPYYWGAFISMGNPE